MFVGGGGGALSRDIRRSKARTRSATPGERGGLPACSITELAATSSDGGDDDDNPGWVNSSAGLPAADCIIGGDSIEAETEELAVRVEWCDGSPRTSNARNGGRPPNSSSRPVRGAFCESSVPSRCTISIVPPSRSSISVLAVCSDVADRPCIVS